VPSPLDQNLPTAGAASPRVVAEASSGASVKVPPEARGVQVTVAWSNLARGTNYFPLPPTGKFLVIAYEIGPGVVPASVHIFPDPMEDFAAKVGEEMGKNPYILALLLMTAPVWLPIYYLESKRAPPTPDCCFVWLEDAATGKKVAGTSPWEWPGQSP